MNSLQRYRSRADMPSIKESVIHDSLVCFYVGTKNSYLYLFQLWTSISNYQIVAFEKYNWIKKEKKTSAVAESDNADKTTSYVANIFKAI